MSNRTLAVWSAAVSTALMRTEQAGSVASIHVGPGAKEKLCGIGIGQRYSIHERRLPEAVTGIGIGSFGEKVANHDEIAVLRGVHERRAALAIARVHIGTLGEQQLKCSGMTRPNGGFERSPTEAVRLIHLRTGGEQLRDGFVAAHIGSPHQRGLTVLVAAVDESALVERQLDSGGASHFGGAHQGRLLRREHGWLDGRLRCVGTGGVLTWVVDGRGQNGGQGRGILLRWLVAFR